MKLRVGFSTTKSIPSRLIRWFTDSSVSHTYIRFHDDFLDADLIMHADWPGVIIEDAELFLVQNVSVIEYELNDPRLKASLKKNLRLLRKKYDYWNLFGWAWVITFKRWAKKKIQKPIENPSKMICVDFALYVLNRAGITDLPYNQYNPNSFKEWIETNYKELGWKKVENIVEQTIQR